MEPAAVSFQALIHPHPDAPPPPPPAPPETPPKDDEVVEVKQEKPTVPVVELTDEPPTCPFAPPCFAPPCAPPPPTPMAPVLVPPGELIVLVGGMYLLGAITGGMLAYSFSKPTCKA